MRISALALCAVLGGCAAEGISGYHGRPITDVAARYGPPVEVWNLPSGERAYVWTLDSNGHPGPPPPWHFQSAEQRASFSKGNLLFNGACVYELIGRQDAKGDWIVRRTMDPGLGCQ